MKLEPKDEAALASLLHNDLKVLGQPPELLGWDHNWSECPKSPTTYPQDLFSYAPPIDALGFHSYCGTPKTPGGAATNVPFYGTESTGKGLFDPPQRTFITRCSMT